MGRLSRAQSCSINYRARAKFLAQILDHGGNLNSKAQCRVGFVRVECKWVVVVEMEREREREREEKRNERKLWKCKFRRFRQEAVKRKHAWWVGSTKIED